MIGLLMLAQVASLGFFDGNKLLRVCSDQSQTGQVLCETYIAGVADTSTWLGVGDVPHSRWCPPSGSTNSDLFGAVTGYLRTHPTMMDFPAPMLALNALSAKFPCHR